MYCSCLYVFCLLVILMCRMWVLTAVGVVGCSGPVCLEGGSGCMRGYSRNMPSVIGLMS